MSYTLLLPLWCAYILFFVVGQLLSTFESANLYQSRNYAVSHTHAKYLIQIYFDERVESAANQYHTWSEKMNSFVNQTHVFCLI